MRTNRREEKKQSWSNVASNVSRWEPIRLRFSTYMLVYFDWLQRWLCFFLLLETPTALLIYNPTLSQLLLTWTLLPDLLALLFLGTSIWTSPNELCVERKKASIMLNVRNQFFKRNLQPSIAQVWLSTHCRQFGFYRWHYKNTKTCAIKLLKMPQEGND